MASYPSQSSTLRRSLGGSCQIHEVYSQKECCTPPTPLRQVIYDRDGSRSHTKLSPSRASQFRRHQRGSIPDSRALLDWQTHPSSSHSSTHQRKYFQSSNLVNRLTSELWRLWLGSYLASCSSRAKWIRPQRTPEVGDIIFLKDDTIRVRQWPIAVVQATYPGDNGQTRAVDILCRGKTYTRNTDRPIPLPLYDVTQLTTSSPSLPVDAPAAPSQAHAYSTTAGSQPRPPEDVQDYVPKTTSPGRPWQHMNNPT